MTILDEKIAWLVDFHVDVGFHLGTSGDQAASSTAPPTNFPALANRQAMHHDGHGNTAGKSGTSSIVIGGSRSTPPAPTI